MKFNIGDTVKVINESVPDDRHLIGEIGKIITFPDRNNTYSVDFGKVIKQKSNYESDTAHKYYEYELELCKKGNMVDTTFKPKYMVYGTGCNNKSDIIDTEAELKSKLKIAVNNSSWTGNIIGYKLIPIFKAKNSIKLTRIK